MEFDRQIVRLQVRRNTSIGLNPHPPRAYTCPNLRNPSTILPELDIQLRGPLFVIYGMGPALLNHTQIRVGSELDLAKKC